MCSSDLEDAAARVAAEALAAELPHATVVTLAGAGRHGVIEAPAALAAIVDAAATSTEVTR